MSGDKGAETLQLPARDKRDQHGAAFSTMPGVGRNRSRSERSSVEQSFRRIVVDCASSIAALWQAG